MWNDLEGIIVRGNNSDTNKYIYCESREMTLTQTSTDIVTESREITPTQTSIYIVTVKGNDSDTNKYRYCDRVKGNNSWHKQE